MSAAPGQTAPQPPAHPHPPAEPQLQPERSSGALSLKDKLALNRKAKAHGLPVLWPEAEMRNTWNEQMRLSGLRGFVQHYERDLFGPLGLGWSWPDGSGGAGIQNDPRFAGTCFAGIGINPLSDPQMVAWHSPPRGRFDDSWLGDLIWPELICEVGEALADSLRSFFSRFRGPLPW